MVMIYKKIRDKLRLKFKKGEVIEKDVARRNRKGIKGKLSKVDDL